MKIVIPIDEENDLQSRISEHFGRASFFAIFEREKPNHESTLQIIPNRSQHTGGRGLPAQKILALNPDIVISTGMGRRAITFFQQARVGVLQCPSGTVEQVLKLFFEKKLPELTQGCVHARHGC